MLNIIKELDLPNVLVQCEECNKPFETNKYDAGRSSLGGICKPCKAPHVGVITQDYLKRLFIYCEKTGNMYARVPRRNRPKGSTLGSVGSHGYLETSIDGNKYLVHRLIWLYQMGVFPDKIDHINHVPLDNRWVNLRNACDQTNMMNTSLSKNSTTGINGVSYCKRLKKFRAYIMNNRKQTNLGWFTDINDAIAAREQADIDYGFHSNHGN